MLCGYLWFGLYKNVSNVTTKLWGKWDWGWSLLRLLLYYRCTHDWRFNRLKNHLNILMQPTATTDIAWLWLHDGNDLWWCFWCGYEWSSSILQAEKQYYQLELVNRETNFTKVFSGTSKGGSNQPNVGFINPLAKVGEFLSILSSCSTSMNKKTH